ncbi:hypothetical protein JXA47_12225 [Candidatus Sumerlaeota bacterium]|nr:hypothetical protein [Candidatus Sumerlaeota bacterium]
MDFFPLLPLAIADTLETAEALRPDNPALEIALGLAIGLFGWPVYFLLVRMTGILVGLAIGILGTLVFNDIRSLGEWLLPVMAMAGLIGALLGVWVVRRVVMIAWLLIGISVGLLGAWALHPRIAELNLANGNPLAEAALWAGTALLAGLLTVWLRRWLVIAATAALGSALLNPYAVGLGAPALITLIVGLLVFAGVQITLHHVVGLAERHEEPEE